MSIEELIKQLQEIAARRPGAKVYACIMQDDIHTSISKDPLQHVDDTSEGIELIF